MDNFNLINFNANWHHNIYKIDILIRFLKILQLKNDKCVLVKWNDTKKSKIVLQNIHAL